MVTLAVSVYPLKNLAILDLGAIIYIFNQRHQFYYFRYTRVGDILIASDRKLPIKGYRKVDIFVNILKGA